MALVARTRRSTWERERLYNHSSRRKEEAVYYLAHDRDATPRTTKRVCANDHLLKCVCVFHQVAYCCEWGCCLSYARRAPPRSDHSIKVAVAVRQVSHNSPTQDNKQQSQTTQETYSNGFPQVHRECRPLTFSAVLKICWRTVLIWLKSSTCRSSWSWWPSPWLLPCPCPNLSSSDPSSKFTIIQY